jgi:hypothetical protein
MLEMASGNKINACARSVAASLRPKASKKSRLLKNRAGAKATPPSAPASTRIVPAGFWAGPRVWTTSGAFNANSCPGRGEGSETTQTASFSIAATVKTAD